MSGVKMIGQEVMQRYLWSQITSGYRMLNQQCCVEIHLFGLKIYIAFYPLPLPPKLTTKHSKRGRIFYYKLKPTLAIVNC